MKLAFAFQKGLALQKGSHVFETYMALQSGKAAQLAAETTWLLGKKKVGQQAEQQEMKTWHVS